jgi:hypothetical protein
VACCRRIYHLFEDERSRHALAVAEQLADGLASESQRAVAAEQARLVDPSEENDAAFAALMAVDVNSPRNHPDAVWGLAVEAERSVAYADPRLVECQIKNGATRYFPVIEILNAHCELLRDIFGSQFHHGAIDRKWRSHEVRRIAIDIYTRRDFDQMPVLGQALEAAGCSDPPLLAHCREPSRHVRGCWVLDLLLGRT